LRVAGQELETEGAGGQPGEPDTSMYQPPFGQQQDERQPGDGADLVEMAKLARYDAAQHERHGADQGGRRLDCERGAAKSIETEARDQDVDREAEPVGQGYRQPEEQRRTGIEEGRLRVGDERHPEEARRIPERQPPRLDRGCRVSPERVEVDEGIVVGQHPVGVEELPVGRQIEREQHQAREPVVLPPDPGYHSGQEAGAQ
jgi:hypothetical protein